MAATTRLTEKRRITEVDILSHDEYAAQREQRRREIIALKQNRRMSVGPFATFYFESFQTMLQQVQEMLWIEKGGDEQIQDELEAYNPLIPQGDELVATVMFEIEDPVRRSQILAQLGGVESTFEIRLGDDAIRAEPEVGDGVERTTEAGKTSSIHFLHFRFTPDQVATFRDPNAQVIVTIGHENYGHMAVMPANVKSALASDFD